VNTIIPENWKVEPLCHVTDVIMGQSPASIYYNFEGEGLPFFQGKTEFGEFYPVARKWCSKPNKIAKNNDVLISVRAPVGPTNIANQECCIGRGLAAVRTLDELPHKYILYFLRSIEHQIDSMGTGTTFKAISGQILRNIPVPIAPEKQQKQIVEEIEKQFSRLDKAVADLKRVKANLKRYKASVLQAAVTGKLTEEWRKQHPDVEPASKLLELIEAERIKWIEQGIGEGNSEAKRLKSKLKRHKFSLPDNIEISEMWSWASLLTASHMVVDCHNKTAPYEDRGIPLVRTTNIRDGKVNIKSAKYITEATYQYWSRRCPPKSGDILFTREAPMGEAAIIPEETKLCMGQRMMLIRVFEKLVLPKFLLSVIMSPVFQQRLIGNAVGTGVKHLRVGDVEAFALAIPPLEEQKAIVEEVESRLSVSEEIERTVDVNLMRAERLRQSILKQAFSGKLC